MTHCPDSRLCFCKAAYGFSSRRCRVCHKYFSQGMLSKTKHWKSSVGVFFGQDKLVGADWELSLTLGVRRKAQIEPGTNEGSEWLCDLKRSELHSLFISALVKLCCCWTGSRSEHFLGEPTFPWSALAARTTRRLTIVYLFLINTHNSRVFFFSLKRGKSLRAISIKSDFTRTLEGLSGFLSRLAHFPSHIDCSVSAWKLQWLTHNLLMVGKKVSKPGLQRSDANNSELCLQLILIARRNW